MSHTRRPWTYDAESGNVYGIGCRVAKLNIHLLSGETHGNGELIVRAVNCHDEMLSALQCAIDFMEGEDLDELHGDLGEVIRAAIANAKGEPE